MNQQHYDNVKTMLDRWAESKSVGGRCADGMPNQSTFAPDARIQSIEDIEIETNKIIVRAVDTAVYELPVLQREAVTRYYGLSKFSVWIAQFDVLFDAAIESLFKLLKNRVVC